jgi:hypothetical protein
MPTVQNHSEILHWWDHLVKNNSVHHAYLVVGAYGNATRELIRACVERLGIVVNEEFTSHPDVIFVASHAEGEGEDTKKNISIEEIRDVRSRLQGFSSTATGWRVVIIECVEEVSVGASNALLKSLEEPGVRTVFFLITGGEHRTLPTIQSRCHTIYTVAPKDWYKEIGGLLPEDEAQCEAFLQGTLAEQWHLVHQLFAKEKNWPLNKTQDVLALWNRVARAHWKQALENGSASEERRLRKILTTLLEAYTYAQANVQTRLIFEHLVTAQTL